MADTDVVSQADNYEIHTEYKTVEFDGSRVNLLWNCCAIVKCILRMQAEIDDLERRVEALENK